MKKILIVTAQKEHFSTFMDGLKQTADVDIATVDSSEKAEKQVAAGLLPDLIVIDETINNVPGLTIARNILMKNAMANQALVSGLSAEDFHEASEGLGIMCQLPPVPDATQAQIVLEILAKMP